MVRFACCLGSNVSEGYSKLSEGEVVCSVRTMCIPDGLALVWRDTISMLFWGSKLGHEMEVQD